MIELMRELKGGRWMDG